MELQISLTSTFHEFYISCLSKFVKIQNSLCKSQRILGWLRRYAFKNFKA